jgi:hypothetical protein
MPRSIPLVATPDEVSVAWMDGVLSGAGIAPAGALESLQGTSIGTGKVGEIVRYALRWRAGVAAPASVVGKFASRDAASRQAGLRTGTYVREVSFYRRLAQSVRLPVPACYGVELDPESGSFVLVLEDLTPARQGDQLKGCTLDEAALALEALPGLHAPHWGSPALARESWLGVRSQSASGLGAIYDALVEPFAARFAARLAAEVIAAARRLRGRVPAWIARDAEPYTLLHGDYRSENMLFGAADARFALAVVDWQTVAIGPGLSDVAYFLGASLPVELRRKHEVELLRGYCASLAAHGIELDWSRCWNEYRTHAFAGLHMAVVASQLVGRDPRSDEMFCVMAERHAAHALDLESFDLLT